MINLADFIAGCTLGFFASCTLLIVALLVGGWMYNDK